MLPAMKREDARVSERFLGRRRRFAGFGVAYADAPPWRAGGLKNRPAL
jgi:hypothetical protein